MSIQRLPVEVVNRIAAGEVVVRPVNVVKELVENSIDAGAKSITILVGQGGLQSIQVIDDGNGIPRSDHALVCERFATSKLCSADDLVSGAVRSFGFRGEALASMSLVSHVSIVSKSLRDSADSGGFESIYEDGILLPNYPAPVPFGGESGARIIIDDLFYNNPIRKQAFKNPSVEYKKILELISKLAISFPRIGFRVRKLGETNFDLVETGSSSTRVSRIESLTGISQNDLIIIQGTEEIPPPLVTFECICGNPNDVNVSKSTIVVVINDRLVDSSFNLQLLRQLESEITSMFQIQRVGFLFLSLTIDPKKLDVNVCPTKGRVVYANSPVVDQYVVNTVLKVLGERRKTKAFKINKIEFSSNFLPRDTVKEDSINPPSQEVIEVSQKTPVKSQPFKIHTCPRQTAFSRPVPETPFMLSLTQVDVALNEPRSQKSENETALPSLDPLFLPCNPRDFVFVGDTGKEGFVLCQYFTRLCLCNTQRLSRDLITYHLLSTDFSLVACDQQTAFSNCPEWIADLFGSQVPSVRSKPAPWQVNQLVSLISVESNDLTTAPQLAELVASWVLDTEYGGDVRVIWDEVIRNKNFLKHHKISSEPPEPLNIDCSRNFYFREVISLKELYKEFERC
jgi:DNA mismatch repair protein MutL